MLEQRRSIWVAGTVLGLVCACPDGGGATASGGGFSAAGSGVVTGPATDGATEELLTSLNAELEADGLER